MFIKFRLTNSFWVAAIFATGLLFKSWGHAACPGGGNLTWTQLPPSFVIGNCAPMGLQAKFCELAGSAFNIGIRVTQQNLTAASFCPPNGETYDLVGAAMQVIECEGCLPQISAKVGGQVILPSMVNQLVQLNSLNFFVMGDPSGNMGSGLRIAGPLNATVTQDETMIIESLVNLSGGNKAYANQPLQLKAIAKSPVGAWNICGVGVSFEWIVEHYDENDVFLNKLKTFERQANETIPVDAANGVFKYAHTLEWAPPANLPCGHIIKIKVKPYVDGRQALSAVSTLFLSLPVSHKPKVDLIEPAGDGPLQKIHIDACTNQSSGQLKYVSCGCAENGEMPKAMEIDFETSGESLLISPFSTGEECSFSQEFSVTFSNPLALNPALVKARVTDAYGEAAISANVQVTRGYKAELLVSGLDGTQVSAVSLDSSKVFPLTAISLQGEPAVFMILSNLATNPLIGLRAFKACFDEFPGTAGPTNPYGEIEREVLGGFTYAKYEVPQCQSLSKALDLKGAFVKIIGTVTYGGPTPNQTEAAVCGTPPDRLAHGAPICGARVTLYLDQKSLGTTLTNALGAYEFKFQPSAAGTQIYSVTAFMEGMNESVIGQKDVSVNSCSGGVLTADLELNLVPKSCPPRGSNPVDPHSGLRRYSVTDINLPGKSGLNFEFTRLYQNVNWQEDRGLGVGWRHNWMMRLRPEGHGHFILDHIDGSSRFLAKIPGQPNRYRGVNGFFYNLTFAHNCWNLVDSSGTTYEFDTAYRLHKVYDRFGNVMEAEYDSLGRLDHVLDSAGRHIQFSYDPQSGRLIQIVLPSSGEAHGNTWTYQYSLEGDLTSVQGPGAGSGYQASYTYNAEHWMLSKSDPRSPTGLKELTYEYDGFGRTVKEKRSVTSEAVIEMTYRANGTPDTKWKHEGYETRLLIDSFGRSRGQQIGGQTKSTTWSLSNQGVTSNTDYRGNATTTSYKPGNRGEVDVQTSPTGLRTSYQYDSYGFGVVTERREKDLNTNVERVYSAQVDALGRITGSNDNGRHTALGYGNGFGEWTTRQDADGSVTTRIFNGLGQLTSIQTSGNGPHQTFTYDGWGRLKTMHDEHSNLLTTHQYDGAGNITRTDYNGDGGSSFVQMGYDDLGRMTSRTDENGKTTTYVYSSDGRDNLLQEFGPEGSYTRTLTYNNHNQLDTETLSGPDGKGGTYTRTSTYEYIQVGCGCANEGKLSKVHVQNASVGAGTQTLTTEYLYDADGNRTDVIDPKGNRTRTTYDGSNRVTSVTSGLTAAGANTPETRTVTYTYNAFGDRLTIQDGKLQTTTFTYNSHGELQSEAPPSGPAIAYDYTAAGKLNSKTDRNNRPWAALYDAPGRMSEETFVDFNGNALTQTFTYGQVADGTNQLKRVDDPTGSRTFAYGHRGRLTGVTFGNLNRSIGFQHDSSGNVVTMSLSVISGPTVNNVYSYDALNRVTQYTDPNGNRFDYAYDADGQIRKVEIRAKQSNNSLKHIVTGRMEYDSTGRALSFTYRKGSSPTGLVISKVEYTYDQAGNRTARNTLATQASYGVNPLNELTSENNSGDIRGAQTFVYDKAGNRSSQTMGASSIGYSVPNSLNRLAVAGGITYQYDNEGSRTKMTIPPGSEGAGDALYSWDGKGRLRKLTQPNGTELVFAYDYTNHRVSRQTYKVGQLVESRGYLYHANQLLEETQNGQRLVVYGWGPSGLVSRTDAQGHSLFMLTDALTSVMTLVNEKGEIVQDLTYDAYGNCLSGADAANAFRFVGASGGMTEDTASGQLVYLWNRWYDSRIGGWISEDPMRYGTDSNRYRYVYNMPIFAIDPTGLWSSEAHDALLFHAFHGKISDEDIAVMQLSSRSLDKRSQGTEQAYMHWMRALPMGSRSGRVLSENFIQQRINDARDIANCDRMQALQILAEGLHTLMDSSSPQHRDANGDPLIWRGLRDAPGHSLTDWIGGETTDDITSQIYAGQDMILWQAYQSVFGGK